MRDSVCDSVHKVLKAWLTRNVTITPAFPRVTVSLHATGRMLLTFQLPSPLHLAGRPKTAFCAWLALPTRADRPVCCAGAAATVARPSAQGLLLGYRCFCQQCVWLRRNAFQGSGSELGVQLQRFPCTERVSTAQRAAGRAHSPALRILLTLELLPGKCRNQSAAGVPAPQPHSETEVPWLSRSGARLYPAAAG